MKNTVWYNFIVKRRREIIMSNTPTTVFAIGRWMPIHLGHKEFLVKLARQYDRLVIGIGSCYENGTPRNCIPAVEREKLLRRMLASEGITNAIILPVQDRPTFREWIDDVCCICERYSVTHFCTGNKEDILDVLEREGLRLDVEMINPETDSSFPYHATDIRNAILHKEWERLETMIPAEIKPMVMNQVAREIEAAARGEGQEFIPGRQTVDLAFTVHSPTSGKNYALIGRRDLTKLDFPGAWAIPGGGIEEFESPIEAAIRVFRAETGLGMTLTDNTGEPATVRLHLPCEPSAELHFIGIYASPDERINGTRGGGSQCFAMHIESEPETLIPLLCSTHDMEELVFVDVDIVHSLTLAFDQKRMLLDALVHLGIPHDNGEQLAVFSEDGQPTGQGISRTQAHTDGVLHGASHTYIYRRSNGSTELLLQRRSRCKDSFPGSLDTSSAGHVEHGSDFLATAQKELQEELGLCVEADELIELFEQRIEHTSEAHGKTFVDREINRVYLLERDVDPTMLRLQPEEVSEVVWMSEDELIDRLSFGDRELCLDEQEVRQVLNAIRARHKN